MNMSDYEQYYQKGGTYVLPIEIFNELFGEMESWKKQSNQLQSNWNSLREFVKENGFYERKDIIDAICNPNEDRLIYIDDILDKMNELEGVDNENN